MGQESCEERETVRVVASVLVGQSVQLSQEIIGGAKRVEGKNWQWDYFPSFRHAFGPEKQTRPLIACKLPE